MIFAALVQGDMQSSQFSPWCEREIGLGEDLNRRGAVSLAGGHVDGELGVFGQIRERTGGEHQGVQPDAEGHKMMRGMGPCAETFDANPE